MQRRSRRFGVTGLLLALGLVLALPGAAIAQTVLATTTTSSSGTFNTSVTIPSGTAAGIYDIAATGTGTVGSAYPPSGSTTIAVSSSLVTAGASVNVFGSGWTPNTTVTLRLELVNLAEATFSLAQVTETRTARARIRVIRPGGNFGFGGFINPPVSGGSNPIIINNNNSSSSSSSAAASAGGGTVAAGAGAGGGTVAAGQVASSPANAVSRGLVRTGVPALPMLAVGVATILLGSVLVSAGRRRTTGQTSFSG